MYGAMIESFVLRLVMQKQVTLFIASFSDTVFHNFFVSTFYHHCLLVVHPPPPPPLSLSPQLYYSYNGFGDPLHYKSAQQQYLLRHMRHPIFTAPFILVWAVPVMSYDRLMLAVLLPLYLAWTSSISALDMKYVRGQFVNKWRQLLKNQWFLN